MDDRVTVYRYKGDLERESWYFYYLSGYGKRGAVLDGWARERRQSKRHKFKANWQERWARLGRHYQHGASKPGVPEDISAEALELFRVSVRMAPDE